ncbi:MAG: DUF4160 domain-containing protein [Bdellovibrionales bacterium]
MGEVFRVRKLRFCVFPLDHGPPHVHVFGPEAEAKFRLDDFSCISCRGFRWSAVQEITGFLKTHQGMLWEAWNENQTRK